MTKISLMQGRLLPPFEERFQAYPALGWQKEFTTGAQLGLYSIEWIYEYPYADENAIVEPFRLQELKELIKQSGVEVRSICADFFMVQRLVVEGKSIANNWQHLEWLCYQAKSLSISYIVLPFVDSSSLIDQNDRQALIEGLRNFFAAECHHGVELHLETDLNPQAFLEVFEGVNHPCLKMNYDIGNSASLGYDPDQEFELLGKYLGSIHVKDRVLNGSTVELGSGNANFEKCFNWFKKLKFQGWYVLQAARGKIGDELKTVAKQIDFVKQQVACHGA